MQDSASLRLRGAIFLLFMGCGTALAASEPAADLEARVRESFSSRVRPVLSKNCFRCHSGEEPKRGLNLTRLETLLAGGKSGPPVVAGRSGESLLFRVLEPGHRPHMPPDKDLDREDAAAIAGWIDRLPSGFSLEKGRLHWAFRKVERPEVPVVENPAWVRTPIDAFLLAKLEENRIAPSPEARKEDLIRRATLDLTGLLPEPEEVDAFLGDDSPRAFEKVVDRLLSSPHYGERWGRHWLDLARFAESEGFKSDEIRPHAWRYRDYVIRSFNQDKPYDRFLEEQIAGDELWPEDADARLATAFNRHYPDESNARNLLQRRQEILNDITDTVGQVFTGLTFGCARCHDHKYDPILQADYYRLQAFFAGVRAVDDLVLAPAEAVRSHREMLAVWEEKTRDLREGMAELEETKRKEIADENFAKFPPEIQAAIERPAAERTALEWQMFYKARPYLYPDREVLVSGLAGEKKKRWQELNTRLDRFGDLCPPPLPVGSAIADVGREAPRTHLLKGGVYDAPGDEVQPGFLSILDPGAARVEPPVGVESTGRRSALARWLARPDNPLTARVMVNRIWHYHFGRGLVATPSDFGAMGDPPTHPRLLDWLASEFAGGGFRLKALHRLIMTSSVYRQASLHREEAARVDREDRLLWRFPRQRLEAEAIRDSALQVAGLLNRKLGGPGVFPELPQGGETGAWKVTADAAERNRRSVYIFVRRNHRYPLLEAFDLPDTHDSCSRRYVTITAPQALMMLNDPLALKWAREFAARLHRDCSPPDGGPAVREALIERAYRIAFSRSPERTELEAALSFFERHRAVLAAESQRTGAALSPPGEAGAGGSTADPLEAAALADFCHMLINSNEFIYRN